MLESALFSRHLEDDEIVTVIVHKHWLIGVKFLLVPIVSFVLSMGALSITHVQIAFYLVALWSMLSIIWFLRNFFDYYLDVWIVTNQGIIDLEWHGWFHRESSRILYSDIQGVSYEIKGILGTILRYGEVAVEKVSTGTTVSLPQVPHPRRIEAVILKNMEEYLHGKNMKNAKHVQEILAGMVAGHVQLDHLSPADIAKAPPISAPSAIQTVRPVAPSKAKKGAGFSASKVGSPRTSA